MSRSWLGIRSRHLAAGLATYVPGLYERFRGGTGGTISAAYCQGVWLKHLSIASAHGLPQIPETVAELGPGDSLGVGLAALISGVVNYHAFDLVRYATTQRNLSIFDELVRLFQERTPVPRPYGFPDLAPFLGESGFPSHILTEERMAANLAPARIEAIRKQLQYPETETPSGSNKNPKVRYVVPWDRIDEAEAGSVDFMWSHAVLEHVDDLPRAYAAMYRWLKPGGYMTHQIDFSSHGYASEWNGQWGYSDVLWRLVRGRRAFLINRQPVSVHLDLIGSNGFEQVSIMRLNDQGGLPRDRLAARFRVLSDEDLICRGVFVVARKPSSPGLK